MRNLWMNQLVNIKRSDIIRYVNFKVSMKGGMEMKHEYFWIELVQYLNSAKTIPKIEDKIFFICPMWMLKIGMNYFLIFSYSNYKVRNYKPKIVANQLNNSGGNLPRKAKYIIVEFFGYFRLAYNFRFIILIYSNELQ